MIITLDFETLPITPYPDYPPKPVGLAIKENNGKSFYLAWGHPTNNNCTETDARDTLESIYEDAYKGSSLLFHNAKFDLAVAKKWFGLSPPNFTKIHDTLLMAFLVNPHNSKIGLKSLAEEYLNWPPEELDQVVNWVCTNLRTAEGKKFSPSPTGKNYAGAYIGYAPGDLVGEYACGDVDRTFGLYVGFEKYIKDTGMETAYDRERQVLLIAMQNEISGIRIDMNKAEQVYSRSMSAVQVVDKFVRDTVGDPELNVGSNKQLASALERVGILDTTKLRLTDKGNASMDKDSLSEALPKVWSELIKYRRNLLTTANTFIKNWLEQGYRTSGIIHTSWNQVAQERHGQGVGTRTGRFSSEPSFLNIPKRIGADSAPEGLSDLVRHDLPPVPYVRELIIPWEPGWYLLNRDYSQQEVRILAHFGNGDLFKQYQADPWTDVYDYVQTVIQGQYGLDLERKVIKATVLGVMYGRGPRALSEALHIPYDDAKNLKALVLRVIPELANMYSETERRSTQGLPIRTWGGRLYYCEDSPNDTPYRKVYAYRMVNNIIQPSAADCTKQAWINLGFDKPGFRMYLTVHDEFLCSVHPDQLHSGMAKLKHAMESVEFDIPILSEGNAGNTDWAHLKPYDKKGNYVFEQ